MQLVERRVAFLPFSGVSTFRWEVWPSHVKFYYPNRLSPTKIWFSVFFTFHPPAATNKDRKMQNETHHGGLHPLQLWPRQRARERESTSTISFHRYIQRRPRRPCDVYSAQQERPLQPRPRRSSPGIDAIDGTPAESSTTSNTSASSINHPSNLPYHRCRPLRWL